MTRASNLLGGAVAGVLVARGACASAPECYRRELVLAGPDGARGTAVDVFEVADPRLALALADTCARLTLAEPWVGTTTLQVHRPGGPERTPGGGSRPRKPGPGWRFTVGPF